MKVKNGEHYMVEKSTTNQWAFRIKYPAKIGANESPFWGGWSLGGKTKGETLDTAKARATEVWNGVRDTLFFAMIWPDSNTAEVAVIDEGGTMEDVLAEYAERCGYPFVIMPERPVFGLANHKGEARHTGSMETLNAMQAGAHESQHSGNPYHLVFTGPTLGKAAKYASGRGWDYKNIRNPKLGVEV